MSKKLLQTGEIFYRTATFERASADIEARTVALSFSSEAPVERYFGTEILDHNPASVRLARLNNSGPLLMDHDWSDQVGVVRSVEISTDKKGRAIVQFSRSAAAQEIFQDVLDGIRANISVGYQIHKAEITSTEQGDTYRATDWEPYEISLVSIPADTTVGVGRSQPTQEVIIMADTNEPAASQTAENDISTRTATITAAASIFDVRAIEDGAVTRERARISGLTNAGSNLRKFGGEEIARELIAIGGDMNEFNARMLQNLGKTSNGTATRGDAPVELNDKEQKQYSLTRAINAQITGDWGNAGFEREVSMALQSKLNRAPAHGGFLMPMNLRTAYGATTVGSGKEGVATDLLGMDMIELLRARTLVVQLGARMMSGLVGNVAINRLTAGATAAWLGSEAAVIAESEGTLDQVTLSPKTIAAFSRISRQALMQSSIDMEAMIREDLALAAAQAIDLGAISGTGTGGQPLGLLNTVGIGSVALGANGAAIDIDTIINLRKTVAKANALRGQIAYLTNPDVVAALQKLKSTTGEYLWEDDTGGEGISGVPGMLKGYPVGETTNVPNNLTKGTTVGTLSAAIFGNFNDLIIGEWGAMEIVANPFGTGFATGQVDIRMMHLVDVQVRHPGSFAVITDAIA